MLGDRYYKTARTEDILGRQALLTDIMRLQMAMHPFTAQRRGVLVCAPPEDPEIRL